MKPMKMLDNKLGKGNAKRRIFVAIILACSFSALVSENSIAAPVNGYRPSAKPDTVKTTNSLFPIASSWPGDTFPAPVSIQTLPSDALFESNSATLSPSAIKSLRAELKLIMSLDPHAKMRIIGHTDSSGPKPYNLSLSRKRAVAVKNWFSEHGLAAKNIGAIGVGSSQPLVNDLDSEGKLIQAAARVNRRVVIELLS